MGSGCGAVGRVVACNTRGPRFESCHRQLLLNIYLLLTVCRKDENKEKRGREWPILKKYLIRSAHPRLASIPLGRDCLFSYVLLPVFKKMFKNCLFSFFSNTNFTKKIMLKQDSNSDRPSRRRAS